MKRRIMIQLTAVTAFLAVGCFPISQYHLGYHNFGDGHMGYSVVSQKSVAGLEDFETRCVRGFVSYRADSLKAVFAPKLDQAVDVATLADLNVKLKHVYGYDGTYERLQVIPRTTMLDEAASKDAFDYYDLVTADYLLKGTSNAVIRLYMTRVNTDVRLAGFEIMDQAENTKGNSPPIKYIFPETIDKAKIAGRSRRI